jgi:uncharacterized coiled-coil protein SlyX
LTPEGLEEKAETLLAALDIMRTPISLTEFEQRTDSSLNLFVLPDPRAEGKAVARAKELERKVAEQEEALAAFENLIEELRKEKADLEVRVAALTETIREHIASVQNDYEKPPRPEKERSSSKGVLSWAKIPHFGGGGTT